MKNLEYLGGFYGESLEPASREALLMRHVPTTRWDVLSELYGKKWYGYRFIDPATCLWIFADRFRKASLNTYGRGYTRPVHSHNLFTKNAPTHRQIRMVNMITQIGRQHVSALFTAMCIADDLGIPYDFYCRHACEFYNRAFKALAMPNKLVTDRVVVEVAEAWQKRLKDGVLLTTADPYYALARFENHPWQVAYQDFLLDQIGERINPKYGIAQVCFKNPQVKPSYAAKRFSIDILRAAQEAASL